MPGEVMGTDEHGRGTGVRVHTVKTIDEIVEYGAVAPMRVSWWLDGQPLMLRYIRGRLQSALLPEGDGRDVTREMKHMRHVPLSIPHLGTLEVLGTAVYSWQGYREIQGLSGQAPEKPGGLARESMRASGLAAAGQRSRLGFSARGISEPADDGARKTSVRLESIGFSPVPCRWVRQGVSRRQVENLCRVLNPFRSDSPALGLVFEYGETGMHGRFLPWAYDIYAPDMFRRLLSAYRPSDIENA